MDQNFIVALAASLIAGTVTTAGIYTIRRFEVWARENTTYFACFAAGVLIAVSFLHIVPKSFAMSPQAPSYLFAGYLLMHLLNRFLTAYVCDKPATAEYALGLIPLVVSVVRMNGTAGAAIEGRLWLIGVDVKRLGGDGPSGVVGWSGL
jgi:zinc and cadmium transporter